MIIFPQKWTVRQVKQADAKRSEFRPRRSTSGCANLDDMIALNKAVILCPDHARKFSPAKAHYRAHPDRAFRRVIGRCDVCKVAGLSRLFICEQDAIAEEKKLARALRALEYGHIYNG